MRKYALNPGIEDVTGPDGVLARILGMEFYVGNGVSASYVLVDLADEPGLWRVHRQETRQIFGTRRRLLSDREVGRLQMDGDNTLIVSENSSVLAAVEAHPGTTYLGEVDRKAA